jgi:anti-anti-sigma factor
MERPCSRSGSRRAMRVEPRAGEPLVVEIDGDLDLVRAGDIGDWLCSLIERRPPAIAVECSAVTFIESRGLAMMARVQRFAQETGCRLTWRRLPLHALRTIHLSGLDGYLAIEA